MPRNLLDSKESGRWKSFHERAGAAQNGLPLTHI